MPGLRVDLVHRNDTARVPRLCSFSMSKFSFTYDNDAPNGTMQCTGQLDDLVITDCSTPGSLYEEVPNTCALAQPNVWQRCPIGLIFWGAEGVKTCLDMCVSALQFRCPLLPGSSAVHCRSPTARCSPADHKYARGRLGWFRSSEEIWEGHVRLGEGPVVLGAATQMFHHAQCMQGRVCHAG